MSISRQNLSIVIVAFKSEAIIQKCIESIDDTIQIIIIENSNDMEFKRFIEKKYHNVQCYLSEKNLGMGAGNNLGIKYVKTDYVLILNPDVVLEKSTINEILIASEKIKSFAILSPLSSNNDYPNYKLDRDKKDLIEKNEPFKVKSVDGFSMLFNIKKLKQTIKSDELNFFDENFFMYLENDDLCKRVKDKNEKIFVVPGCKIKHFGAKAVSESFFEEIELSRNWHWSWSKFYFSKKHKGYYYALMKGLPKFISSIIKSCFYYIILRKYKSKIYYNRAFGFFNAMVGKSSWYRPKLD